MRRKPVTPPPTCPRRSLLFQRAGREPLLVGKEGVGLCRIDVPCPGIAHPTKGCPQTRVPGKRPGCPFPRRPAPPLCVAVPPCRRAAVPPCRRAAVPPCQVWTTHGAPARGKNDRRSFSRCAPMRGDRPAHGLARRAASRRPSRHVWDTIDRGAAASPRADEWTGEGTNNREGGVHPIGRRGRGRRVVRPPTHRGLARAHRRGDAPLRARDRTAGLPSTG